ncbi:MAG: hypothetical protein ACK5LG_21840 [Bacteroides thetaiotaomicron]
MAIDFSAKKTLINGKSAKEDMPKSKFWLNIGYSVAGANEDGSDAFVSLPFGIPLDSMEHVKTNSKNEDFRAFQQARNNLLDELKELSANMKPGEEMTIQLEVQLRHVNEEVAEPSLENNKFVRSLQLA